MLLAPSFYYANMQYHGNLYTHIPRAYRAKVHSPLSMPTQLPGTNFQNNTACDEICSKKHGNKNSLTDRIMCNNGISQT